MTESRQGLGARAAAIRSFLIADIRGYTSFTAEHGDEAASRLAAKFAEVAGEAIEAWGGTLVEIRGDEVLAAFDSGRGLVPHTGFEPVISALRGRCPRPLDECGPMSAGIVRDGGEYSNRLPARSYWSP